MGLMRRDGIEEETLGKVEDDVLIKKPSISTTSPETKACDGSPLIRVVILREQFEGDPAICVIKYWSIMTSSFVVCSGRADTRRIKRMEPLTEP